MRLFLFHARALHWWPRTNTSKDLVKEFTRRSDTRQRVKVEQVWGADSNVNSHFIYMC